MKKIWILLFFVSLNVSAQRYNIKKGEIANGYDVVAYFSNQALKGRKNLTVKHDGVIFNFFNEENLIIFKKNTKKYIPQYGGYCAYAIGKTTERVSSNPETFEIRNGKLYLFYNFWGNNTLKLWKQEDTEKLKKQADINWQKLNH